MSFRIGMSPKSGLMTRSTYQRWLSRVVSSMSWIWIQESRT
ncbi:hypothetical protein ABN034_13845 [Actinopolymorpha sp. B11F2]